MPSDTVAQNHHARPVARRVECQIERKTTSRKGISQNCHPRPSEWTACVGADNFNVHLGMIDVPDLKGPVSVAGCSWFQLEIEGCVGIGGAPAQPLQRSFEGRTLSHGSTERDIARRDDAMFVALPLQRCPGGNLCLLPEILVIVLYKLDEQVTRLLGQAADSVSPLTGLWQ